MKIIKGKTDSKTENSSKRIKSSRDHFRQPTSNPFGPGGEKRDKVSKILDGFIELWTNLFTSPVHLDSALSKQTPRLKGILAQIVPSILLRPTAIAEALGVGIPEGEPWSLEDRQRVCWRPAQLMAERLYEGMTQKWPEFQPNITDFPSWMTDEWKKDWDGSTVDELVSVLGREAPLSLRASQRVGAEMLLEKLTAENLPTRIEVSHFVPWGVRLAGYAPVLNTDLYRGGAFEIQDEGSQLMALFALWPEQYGHFLKDRPGAVLKKVKNKKKELPLALAEPPLVTAIVPAIVIDACAGAGGKSLAMADALKGKGRVYSYDTSEKKLQALRRRATRMGLNNIQAVAVREGSESELIGPFKGKADIVLVDAPCSGWGVLRRNPDIKWRQKRDVLTRMPEIQFRLLSVYSDLVAPGGRLVYGVCTFRLSETQEVVQRFLKDHSTFRAEKGGFLGPGPCDGFFMQSFIKG